jgi:hypothetical protein
VPEGTAVFLLQKIEKSLLRARFFNGRLLNSAAGFAIIRAP